MTQSKLSKKQIIMLGSMLFGLFFGAGNLIFPIHLGQLAGGNWLPATLGFIITAIILPLLAILAISMTESDSMYNLARPVGHAFALFFLIATHATLGLLIASPRTAATSFEIGILPFIPKGSEQISLLIYSALFFLITYFMSRNPNKMPSYVGKLLNPLLLILLAVVFIAAFLIRGDGGTLLSTTHATAATSNLTNGFLQGYNTMDALAGLGFGVTIVAALKAFGIANAKERSKDVAKVGAISMGLEAIIYALLIMLGVISLNFTKLSANGGTAFSTIMTHYTGTIGTGILAAMAIIACLTTSIGLVTSFSQDLGHRFPKIGFHRFLIGTSIGSFLIANFGLDNIVALSTPILMLLYPLAIALIILGMLHPFIGKNRLIYQCTIGLTLIPAILDAIHALPSFIGNLGLFKAINGFGSHYIPLFDLSMEFLPFMLVGLIGGILLAKLLGQPMHDTQLEPLEAGH
ncbi:branched-chain amino acid transport system II carrier protein [Lacticaseibacillus daqingensis]|uniref:branched-chain amino acid transport system II carrier protein n=1 Tax=Lacticaseibacillus daqingensis TaxID=2486014 RepID=UPI000F789777|nr:branched-chain amino acid transport system II carrier protein [Lacticaseibacillus daqingensis]